jgi:hypothetical protein
LLSVPEPVFPARSPLDKTRFPRQAGFMGFESESPFDSLWQEYARVFQDRDDLTLARWLAKSPWKIYKQPMADGFVVEIMVVG